MRTRDRRSTGAMAAGIVAAAGLGLAGCNTEGPEEGTDVEGVPEGEVLESSPAPDNNPTAGDTFVIAGAAGTAVDPLLIVEEQEIPPLDDRQVVQVTGTVAQDFDIAATEEELGIGLENELYADHVGEPYLMATRGEILEQERLPADVDHHHWGGHSRTGGPAGRVPAPHIHPEFSVPWAC
ncbi:hypothetical protein [Kocuria oceani]|uniref:Uncharacterized protein n=1 Tax=Kocuria oceani TaxID=988827 RepID=A0ABV9TNP3_9MICC|nr:hypothetical protein [Kocuria oceani]